MSSPASERQAGSSRGLRGPSLGGFGDRTSLGPTTRVSIQGDMSVFSQGSSFLDAPVDKILQGLNESGDFRGFEDIHLGGNISNLPKEVIFSKIETIAQDRDNTRVDAATQVCVAIHRGERSFGPILYEVRGIRRVSPRTDELFN